MRETIKRINWLGLSCFPLTLGLLFICNNLLLENKTDFFLVFVVAMSYGLMIFILEICVKLQFTLEEKILYAFGFLKYTILFFSFLISIIVLLLGAGICGFITVADSNAVKSIPKNIAETNDVIKIIFYFGNLYCIIFLFSFLTRHKIEKMTVNFNKFTYYPGEKIVINPFLKFEIKPIKKELHDYFVFDFCCEDGNFRTRIDFLADIDFWEAKKMDLRYIDAAQTAVKTGATIRKELAEMCPFKTFGEFIKHRNYIIKTVNLSNPPVKITQIKFEV